MSRRKPSEEANQPSEAAERFAQVSQEKALAGHGSGVDDAVSVPAVLDVEDGEFQPETNSEGKVTLEAAIARNQSLLARGEEPITDDIEELDLDARPEANQDDIFPPGIGEDTMAIKQSQNVTAVDGVAEENPDLPDSPTVGQSE